jgi:hypothetical protein
MEEIRSPRLIHNWISTIGAVSAAICGLVIIFFLILSIVSEKINPYLGILIYLVLPAFLVAGLLLVPLGMYLEWRKRQKTGRITYRKWPNIDLNNVRHRHAAVIFILGTMLFMLMSSVGIYQAYHFTYGVTRLLRPHVPYGDEAGMHRISEFPPCAREVRRMPYRAGYRVVCTVKAVRTLPGIRGPRERLSPSRPDADQTNAGRISPGYGRPLSRRDGSWCISTWPIL